MTHPYRLALALVLPLTLLSSVSFGQTSPSVQAYSKPSQDVTLTFAVPGRMAKVFVKEGDRVARNQPLAQLDDRAERAEVAIQESKAKNITAITAQETMRDQKQINYKRYLAVAEKSPGGVTPIELDAARVDAEVEQAKVDVAVVSHEQDILTFDKAKALLEKCTLLSPIAGWVEEIHVREGEGVDSNASSKVIRIVNVDPLWIDASVPINIGRNVRTGDTAEVRFPETDKNTSCKVTFVGAVADAASGTVLIRLEIPNPNKRLAGEQVNVFFQSKTTAKSEVTR